MPYSIQRTPRIPDQDLAYEYDAMGNRVRTIENGVVTDYTTNALNQYTQVGSATYTYDADGNLISIADGCRDSTLHVRRRGSAHRRDVTRLAASTSYEYNALNHRVATVENGTRTEFLNDPTGLVDARRRVQRCRQLARALRVRLGALEPRRRRPARPPSTTSMRSVPRPA